MAKILRTEQLSVDGDNIRLTADQGNLIINSVSGDDLTPITSTTKIGQDISSLAERDTEFDTDVSSLAAKNSEAENLAITASKYGAYGLETSNLSTGTGSSVQTITLSGRAFISKPVVTATLTGAANDPIIAVMVSDVSETATTGVYQATFQFSDELPSTGETDQATNYKLNIVACINGTDADLDTVIDDMDSDRDGDGVANSLDYDPDDRSIASFSDTLKPSCNQVALHLQPADGETITDKSSNEHTITIVGDTTVDNTATLFGGDTINFDGDGDYLTVGDTSTFKFLNDGTTDYTVECWVNFSTIGSLNPIIGTAGNSSTNGFSMYYTGGTNNEWRAIIWKGTQDVAAARIDVSQVLETNRWYHLAAVHTNNTLYFYIDGVLGGSQSASNYSTASSFRELRIGSFDPSQGVRLYSDCHIQDIRLSKKATYTSDFTPPTNLLDNPC
jgi:hypothetical protein